MEIPFIGGSYDLDNRHASVQRTVNLIPTPEEPGNERTAWVFKDAPGLESWSIAPDPEPAGEYVFLDTMLGEAAVSLSARSPDTAPVGFAWTKYTAFGLVSNGSGLAQSEEANDGLMNSSGSSPSLDITLPETYNIEFTGRPSIEGSEVCYFVISTGPDFVSGSDSSNENFRVGVGRAPLGIGGSDYKVFVSWVRSGLGSVAQTYPVADDSEVEVEVRFTPTEFTVYIDGVLAEPDSGGSVSPTIFAPLTEITNIGLRADAHPTGALYTTINRVAIFIPP